MPAQGRKEPFFIEPETQDAWLNRLRVAGFSDDLVNEILEVRSLQAFIDFCHNRNVAEADIDGERLISERT